MKLRALYLAIPFSIFTQVVSNQFVFSSLTVNAKADIFDAGRGAIGDHGGTAPVEIDFSAGSVLYFSFPSVTGIAQAGIGWPNVGPDGGTTGPLGMTGTSIFAANGISGIKALRFQFLAGVFLDDSVPTLGTQPVSLDFTSVGLGFNSLSPLLQQPFFIGDGLSGIGSGTSQQFTVPAGATRLFLGIADSSNFGWPNGAAPNSYSDNSGSFSLDYSAVPEPASLALLAIGWATMQKRRR